MTKRYVYVIKYYDQDFTTYRSSYKKAKSYIMSTVNDTVQKCTSFYSVIRNSGKTIGSVHQERIF